MASNAFASAALFITFNLLFFTLVSSNYTPCPPPPPKKHHTPSPTKPSPTKPSPSKPPPSTPSPTKPSPTKPPPTKPPPTPSPTTPSPTPPSPTPPSPTIPSPSGQSCPIDALKLGVCADVLSGLINIVIGGQSNPECCNLINGLADLDAAVCLCTALKANVLGINLNFPISLSLLLNNCGKYAPSDYQCK